MRSNEHLMNTLSNGTQRTPPVTRATYVKLIQLSIDTLGNAVRISIPKVYVSVLLGADYYADTHDITIWLEPCGWSRTLFGYKKFRVILLKGMAKGY